MSAQKHEKYQHLIGRARALSPTPCAVAHTCDESSLRGAVEAAQTGLIRPILVGPTARIEALAAQCELDLSMCERVDAPHSVGSAEAAVKLAREGKAEMLMKGTLNMVERFHQSGNTLFAVLDHGELLASPRPMAMASYSLHRVGHKCGNHDGLKIKATIFPHIPTIYPGLTPPVGYD